MHGISEIHTQIPLSWWFCTFMLMTGFTKGYLHMMEKDGHTDTPIRNPLFQWEQGKVHLSFSGRAEKCGFCPSETQIWGREGCDNEGLICIVDKISVSFWWLADRSIHEKKKAKCEFTTA